MNFILHRLLLIVWLVGLGLGLEHLKAGASSGAYNVETNLETATTQKRLKTPKNIKKQPRQTIKNGVKFTRWSITIGSIFTLLAMVGLGIGLGVGILWLPFAAFGGMFAYMLYSVLWFFNKKTRDTGDYIILFLAGLISSLVFGLAAVVLGLIFSTLWVWIAGIGWFVLSLGFLLFAMNVLSGVRKINY